MPQLEADPARGDYDHGNRELKGNSYPGRVIIMGLSDDGTKAVQTYAIMGRSEGSRNRIFTPEGKNVRTIAPDKTTAEMAKTAMADLIYYRAMRGEEGVHVVSNGAQTDPILEAMLQGKPFNEAVTSAPVVRSRKGGKTTKIDLSKYEPDDPNFTPRISGVIDLREDAAMPFGLSVTRRVLDSDVADTAVYYGDLHDFGVGTGYGVQTYEHNNDPLPPYNAIPFSFEMGRDHIDTAANLWSILNQDNRVAVVSRAIDLETGQHSTTFINGRA